MFKLFIITDCVDPPKTILFSVPIVPFPIATELSFEPVEALGPIAKLFTPLEVDPLPIENGAL